MPGLWKHLVEDMKNLFGLACLWHKYTRRCQSKGWRLSVFTWKVAGFGCQWHSWKWCTVAWKTPVFMSPQKPAWGAKMSPQTEQNCLVWQFFELVMTLPPSPPPHDVRLLYRAYNVNVISHVTSTSDGSVVCRNVNCIISWWWRSRSYDSLILRHRCVNVTPQVRLLASEDGGTEMPCPDKCLQNTWSD